MVVNISVQTFFQNTVTELQQEILELLNPFNYSSAAAFARAVRGRGGRGSDRRLRLFWKGVTGRGRFTRSELQREWKYAQNNFPAYVVTLRYQAFGTVVFALRNRAGSEKVIPLASTEDFSIRLGDAGASLQDTIERAWDNRKLDFYEFSLVTVFGDRGAGYAALIREGSSTVTLLTVS